MRKHVPQRLVVLLMAFAFALVSATAARAADYVLGVDDEISISVWLHPELERRVAITNDGTISFAPIGSVPAAGLTPKVLADRLGERLSSFLRQTTTVTVTVTQYLSQSVYVTGAVGKPGRYGFQSLPNLVDVISAAGGAAPGADLTRVQVVRKDGESRRILDGDVASAMREGNTTQLPELKPGDTIIINSFAGAFAAAPGDAIALIGEVTKPGLYQAGSGINLLMALGQAGGLTARADLSRVRIVTPTPTGQQVATVNVRSMLDGANTRPVTLHTGDVLYIPATGTSGGARLWQGITQTLSVSRDLVNIVIVADYLDKRK